ncbi:MAG: tRNA (adenosine(37)-N6)-threonylcarbamoyltransferase complex ATPase subunit type 1 TsaE [Methylococcales bacterium]
MKLFLSDTDATEQLGAQLFKELPERCVVFLHGDLGAGKTTLVRGFLRAAGFSGTVKSPTYNLVEEYTVNGRKIYHFDLYRLNDPEELELIGIRDYFSENSVCFIEWPEHGGSLLPNPDKVMRITVAGQGRDVSVE